MSKEKIIVIGGGPAGMMAAIQAGKKPDVEVMLLEQNEKLGKKLFITGKGRCNITNSQDISEFFENIPQNREFMYSALYTFTNDNLIDFFNQMGVETKIERGNRIFPVSDKSSDVIKALETAMRASGVSVSLNTKVVSVSKYGDYFTVKTNAGNYQCDKLIIATGGLSYPVTGSSGDGYRFGKSMGHSVSQLHPSLVPVILKDDFLDELQGLSIKNAEISLVVKEKVKHREFGEFLFAHNGITGPIVLTLSQYISDYANGDVKLFCNFKPALDEKTLDLRLQREISENSNKQIITVMYNLLPRSLAAVVLNRAEVDEKTPCNQITKVNRLAILNQIRKFEFSFDSLADIKLAIITKGGMNLKEINSSTMESKIVENLYFCGEMLDVNGFTGGFNLQIAFSTGYLAGMSV